MSSTTLSTSRSNIRSGAGSQRRKIVNRFMLSLTVVFTVLAINLTRLVAWWDARPKAQTRPSRFAAGMRHAATARCGAT